MEKKIIAIVMVTVLIVTCFAACKKKDNIYVDDDGATHVLMTDEEGNTVLNSDGELVVCVTDKDGNVLKDENGEIQTAAVDFPEVVVNKNKLETPYYRLTLPDEWEADDGGEVSMKENEKISFKIYNLGEADKTIDQYFKESTENVDDMEKIKEKYPATTWDFEKAVITMKNIDTRVIKVKIASSDTVVEYYNQTVEYIYKGDHYCAIFNCKDNSYDPEFDFVKFLNDNLVMK